MRFIGDIALDAEVRAIASGAITDGEPVVVNSAGTVSGVTDATSQAIGTPVEFEENGEYVVVAFDSNVNKVVVAYSDASNSNYGTCRVGTIDPSDNSITFGTAAVFTSSYVVYPNIAFDSNANKFVIVYKNAGGSDEGIARVATISGTDISYGTAVTFTSDAGGLGSAVLAFDSNANKMGVFYDRRTGNAEAKVATISGTDISFGSAVEITGNQIDTIACAFDSNVNKFVVFYRGGSTSTSAYARVGTISGTGISFGTAVEVRAGVGGGRIDIGICFDTNANRFILGYRHYTGTHGLYIKVGTISGTDFSVGSEVTIATGATQISNNVGFFNPDTNTVLVMYRDATNSNVGTFKEATIDGTSVTLGSATVFRNEDIDTDGWYGIYDTNSDRGLLVWNDSSGSDDMAAVLKFPIPTNITSENYIGIANAAYADGQKATVKTTGSIARNVPAQLAAGSAGTPVVPDEEGAFISATFDSNSNRVVVAYQDGDNSNYGTAVVGTVTASDNSISHGTPVVFNSANTYYTESTFDSNSNKVVITYRNTGDSNRGTAIVGTVDPSDNSISFGTAVVYEAGETSNSSSAFDSSNNKVVIAYEDEDDSQKGKAIVGTVSGTAISFGTAAVFNNANTGFTSTAFDTTNNKVVIAFADKGNSNRGTAIVGTVSGTDISFGSEVIFNSGTSAEIHHSISFNPVAGKMLIAYVDTDDSEKGKAIVGTVSGTSISFGTASVYNTRPEQSETVYDSERDLIVIVYGDNNNSRRGTAIGATISGTSVSFSAELAFHSSSGNKNGVRVTYDSNANKAVAAYTDAGNSNVLTTTVFATAGNGPLVIGQQYFVQTDGTLGTSADSPSVIAGTAIGASDLIVKG